MGEHFHLNCVCPECREVRLAASRAHRSEEALGRISAKIKDWRYVWFDYKEEIFKVLNDWAKYHRSEASRLSKDQADMAMEHALSADAFDSALQLLEDEVWDVQEGRA